jgi:hypothetical protein
MKKMGIQRWMRKCFKLEWMRKGDPPGGMRTAVLPT